MLTHIWLFFFQTLGMGQRRRFDKLEVYDLLVQVVLGVYPHFEEGIPSCPVLNSNTLAEILSYNKYDLEQLIKAWLYVKTPNE